MHRGLVAEKQAVQPWSRTLEHRQEIEQWWAGPVVRSGAERERVAAVPRAFVGRGCIVWGEVEAGLGLPEVGKKCAGRV